MTRTKSKQPDATMLEVKRQSRKTIVTCSACFLGCESMGSTTVEALMSLPCGHFERDRTVDLEQERRSLG